MMEECGGVFGEEDNKFMFNNVIVGRKSYARFKIINTNKVIIKSSFLTRNNRFLCAFVLYQACMWQVLDRCFENVMDRLQKIC